MSLAFNKLKIKGIHKKVNLFQKPFELQKNPVVYLMFFSNLRLTTNRTNYVINTR